MIKEISESEKKRRNNNYFYFQWDYIINFFDKSSLDCKQFFLESCLSDKAISLSESAIYSLASDKSSEVYNYAFRLAELSIEYANEALNSEDESAYISNYGDKDRTLYEGRLRCKRAISFSRWILDGKPDMRLFEEYANATEQYLLYMKFKENIVNEVSQPLYLSGNKQKFNDLFVRYKADFSINDIKSKPIKKISKLLYFLSNFDSMPTDENYKSIIESSIKYFWRLAINWRGNQMLYLGLDERILVAYIYGQFISGRTAPTDFMHDLRGF